MRLSSLSFFLVLISLIGCSTPPTVLRSDALWNIISTQCLAQKDSPQNPCAQVNVDKGVDRGFVVFKDRIGDFQYLLMPTAKITGIESPVLLEEATTNYFDLAWKARNFMEKKYGSVIPQESVSLAINSFYGRSQNQLHIHISCPKVEVQKAVAVQSKKLKAGWSILPDGLLDHQYYARKVSEQELNQRSAFRILADELPDAKDHMAEFGLGLIAVKNKKATDLILLATRRDPATTNRGSIEEIQDHGCPQLR